MSKTTAQIVVRYTSADGVNETRQYKTAAKASAWALERVGADAEVHDDSAQAISTDGIGRITWTGCRAADLFPAIEAQAATVDTTDDSAIEAQLDAALAQAEAQENIADADALAQTDSAFVQTDGPADAIHGEDSAALGHDSHEAQDDQITDDTAAAVQESAPATEQTEQADKPASEQAAPKPAKTLTTRGASVSETWKRPEVRKARSTHHEVSVAGKGKFKSVPEAFRALGLPMGKMIPFRLLVKETGAATFERIAKDGTNDTFEFTRVG